MTDPATGPRPPRITLDGQLVGYWDREATRLDALARGTRFRWLARSFARKADRARAEAARGRAREAARGRSSPAPDAAGA